MFHCDMGCFVVFFGSRQVTHPARRVGDPSGRVIRTVAAVIVTRAAMLDGLEGQWTGHSLRRRFDSAARRASRRASRRSRGAGSATGGRRARC